MANGGEPFLHHLQNRSDRRCRPLGRRVGQQPGSHQQHLPRPATEADGERYFQITPDLVQRVGKGEPHLNLRPIESAAIDLAHSALLLQARCQKQELETDYQNATGVWRLNPSL